MRSRSWKAWAVGVPAAFAAASLGGCSDDASVVGGACAPGYSACGTRCCADGELFAAAWIDGGAGQASSGVVDAIGGDAAADAALGGGADASSLDAQAAPESGPDGGAADDGAVGDGDTRDGSLDAASLDPPVAAVCEGSLATCGASCVDLSSNPSHCGACGRVCPSNLCADGACQGSAPGDVVVIGHDYVDTPAGSAQARVLSNAVFIPRSNPLRVMIYERYAQAAAVARVKAIVDATAAQLNRSVSYTRTTVDSEIPAKLDTQDVLLVHDQAAAVDGELDALGASWRSTLDGFTHKGGVVIVLDGRAGSAAQMHRFATSAGLLQVTSHAGLADGSSLTVEAPGDVVGVGVLSPYGAGSHSATFKVGGPPDSAGVVVVRETSGAKDAVVVHRVVR